MQRPAPHHRSARSDGVLHDALSAFLDRNLGTACSDDVGPLLGQVAWLYDADVLDDAAPADLLHDAQNAALASDALREAQLRDGGASGRAS